MAVKQFKISVLEDDTQEFGIPVEYDLLDVIRRIKFSSMVRTQIESDEELEIRENEGYNIPDTLYVNGVLKITGALGVL